MSINIASPGSDKDALQAALAGLVQPVRVGGGSVTEPVEYIDVGTASVGRSDFTYFLNPGATVTPAYGRANLLRLVPYGNGDINPPTSGETITAGDWTVVGYK